MPLLHFLLVYDRSQQQLVFERAYADPTEALKAYEEKEQQHRHETDKEIVLIGADSIETVRLTHGNYFEHGPGAAASPYLTGV